MPGCARALREPPSLDQLGGASPKAEPDQVGGIRQRAFALYDTREPEQVREAVDLWLQAAKADQARTEALIEAAEASVWLANHLDDPSRRLEAAELAIGAAQWCERIEPGAAACSYWLGAGLGVQARERKTTGLDALPRIVEAFQQVASSDPSFERGGADRALALVYLRAPGWPTGPGDPDLALEHARKAVEVDPGYPPNQLALAEALQATGDSAGSRMAYQRALDLARRSEGTEPDAPDWIRQAREALK